jgi:N-dimethylarginine dimethylaminohydrolase
MFVCNGTGILKKVLLCKPAYLRMEAINEIAKKWIETGASPLLDTKKMEEEHRLLVRAYEANGVSVVFIDAEADLPYQVFARDFGGCIREGFILGRFRESLRHREREVYKKKMEELGIPLAAEVKRGLFEGGDFCFLDNSTIAIGMIARSDAEGVEEVRMALKQYGYIVLGVPAAPRYLHLDMCFNLVTENLAVAYPPCLGEEFLAEVKKRNIEIIAGTERAVFDHGYNLQSIGGGRVVSLKRNEALNEALDKKGITVIPVDITEILKAGGGPHCMTFPLERGA